MLAEYPSQLQQYRSLILERTAAEQQNEFFIIDAADQVAVQEGDNLFDASFRKLDFERFETVNELMAGDTAVMLQTSSF